MLSLPASQRPDGPRRSVRPRGVVGARRVAAGLAGATGVLAAATLVRIQRMRRTAAVHGRSLDHTATIGAGEGPATRLLVLGDSAARGYGMADAAHALPNQVASRLAARTGRPVEVAAQATDGHRTADVLAEQVPVVAEAHPDVVVVGVGVNDAIGRTPDTPLAADTVALVRAVRARAPAAGIVLVACPDLSGAPGFGWPLRVVVGWRCRQVARVQQSALAPVCAADDRVRVVHLPRPDASMFGVDGFHPGVTAHTAMAELVAPVVAELLDDPTDAVSREEEPAWTSD